MQPAQATLLNAIVLVALGLWGYFGSESPSSTALIPVAFGVILGLTVPAIRQQNRLVAHIVVVLTLILIVALFMPLRGALERGDQAAIIRVSLMLLTSILAMIAYVRSFIQARKNREA